MIYGILSRKKIYVINNNWNSNVFPLVVEHCIFFCSCLTRAVSKSRPRLVDNHLPYLKSKSGIFYLR